MSELRLLIGLPASGKSEYAKSLIGRINCQGGFRPWVRINWDEMRKARGDATFRTEGE